MVVGNVRLKKIDMGERKVRNGDGGDDRWNPLYFFLMIGMSREHQVNEKPLLKTVDVVILNGFDS